MMAVQSVVSEVYAEKVSLSAVMGKAGNAEENTYAKYTPAGKLELQIENEALRGAIKPGQKFYVDLTPVPADPAPAPAAT